MKNRRYFTKIHSKKTIIFHLAKNRKVKITSLSKLLFVLSKLPEERLKTTMKTNFLEKKEFLDWIELAYPELKKESKKIKKIIHKNKKKPIKLRKELVSNLRNILFKPITL